MAERAITHSGAANSALNAVGAQAAIAIGLETPAIFEMNPSTRKKPGQLK